MKIFSTLIICLIVTSVAHAQIDSTFRYKISFIINSFSQVHPSYNDDYVIKDNIERQGVATAGFDTIMIQGNKTDSVFTLVSADQSSKTIDFAESHYYYGKMREFLSGSENYIYKLDTNGAVVYAYHEKSNEPGERIDVIDVKNNLNNASLQTKYLAKAKPIVLRFFDSEIFNPSTHVNHKGERTISRQKVLDAKSIEEILVDFPKKKYKVTAFCFNIFGDSVPSHDTTKFALHDTTLSIKNFLAIPNASGVNNWLWSLQLWAAKSPYSRRFQITAIKARLRKGDQSKFVNWPTQSFIITDDEKK